MWLLFLFINFTIYSPWWYLFGGSNKSRKVEECNVHLCAVDFQNHCVAGEVHKTFWEFPALLFARFLVLAEIVASCAGRKSKATSSLCLVLANSKVPSRCFGIPSSCSNLSPRWRMTSMGHRVQVPEARESRTWEIASIRELLPALWFPMATILRSFMTSSVPQSRSAWRIETSFLLPVSNSVPTKVDLSCFQWGCKV